MRVISAIVYWYELVIIMKLNTSCAYIFMKLPDMILKKLEDKGEVKDQQIQRDSAKSPQSGFKSSRGATSDRLGSLQSFIVE